MTDAAELVARNVRAYAKVHRDYERKHGEIFNEVEQARLRDALAAAVASVEGEPPRRALDLGCGTGNLSAHLLALGLEVVGADVSPDFLAHVERRFGGAVETLRVDGLGLAGIADGAFDLVACYSVLHHVPDYLAMVEELHRVTRPGGVIYLDHERTEAFWGPDPARAAFQRALDERRHPGWWHPTRKRWQRYLMPSKYVFAVRQKIDPLFWLDEADIHVWEGDHVEWARIEALLRRLGAEVVAADEYLLYEREYPRDVYEAHRERCADMRLLVARRSSS